MDALKADLHSQATKIGGLSPKFGMFATKPVMLRERRGLVITLKKAHASTLRGLYAPLLSMPACPSPYLKKGSRKVKGSCFFPIVHKF
ncbi:MAG: hypothetical protein CTY16_06890 [Methylobacter sp.]|nr:MAG: hypothetical protein CTY16_06890 [Methylobacter sp.]